jgi:altronate dehydratase small subunit
MKNAYRVNERDNVAMLMQDVSIGDKVAIIDKTAGNPEETVSAVADIPAGHKIALADIVPGGLVIKYGAVIGTADFPIATGEHVHLHNMSGLRGRGDKR